MLPPAHAGGIVGRYISIIVVRSLYMAHSKGESDMGIGKRSNMSGSGIFRSVLRHVVVLQRQSIDLFLASDCQRMERKKAKTY